MREAGEDLEAARQRGEVERLAGEEGGEGAQGAGLGDGVGEYQALVRRALGRGEQALAERGETGMLDREAGWGLPRRMAGRWAGCDELVLSGVLKENGDELRFTQDYLFTSSSAAAAVISGTSMNGRISWKLADGTTLRDWEERELSGK